MSAHFLTTGEKMKVRKLLTVFICGCKFINRGFEVLYVKTYCLFSKVTNGKKIQDKPYLLMNHDIARLSIENP